MSGGRAEFLELEDASKDSVLYKHKPKSLTLT